MKTTPPFVACFERMACQQAVMAMVLEHFTKVAQTKEAMDILCGAEKGKYTWPYAAMTNLVDAGYEVVSVGDFNIRQFAQNPEGLLTPNKNTPDIAKLQGYAQEAVKYIDSGKIIWENKAPTISDIKRYVDDPRPYLISHWMDAAKIDGTKGSRGHFVLVYGIDKKEEKVIFHNPGGYTEEGEPRNICIGQTLSYDRFTEASVPENENGAFLAIRLR